MNAFDDSRVLSRLGVGQPVKQALLPCTEPSQQARSWAHISSALEAAPAARRQKRWLWLTCACAFVVAGIGLTQPWWGSPLATTADPTPGGSSPVVLTDFHTTSSDAAPADLRLLGGAEFKRLALDDLPELRHLRDVTFEDGSRIEALEAHTTVEALAMTARDVTLRLMSGSIDVRVTKGGLRKWVIEAGSLSVEVVGTHFVLTRSPDLSHVAVKEGVVLVRSPQLADGVRRLVAGESQQIKTSKPTPTERRATTFETWLHKADEARRTGDLHAARQHLQHVLHTFPNDARSGVVAFQLALVVQQIGASPEQVVAAFESALAKARGQSLRQDCYWRLVLALEHAGQNERAKARAKESLDSYPNGRYASELKRRLNVTPLGGPNP